MDNKAEVKRAIIELQKEFGNVLPIEQIIKVNPEITEEDFTAALKELKDEGMVSLLDDDSIQVNL